VHTEIHSDDAVVMWWPDRKLLFCGDTLEDTVTYVDEPEQLDVRRANLSVLRELEAQAILPNYGDPDVIAARGYSSGLIPATDRYLDLLLRTAHDDELAALSLRDVVPLLESDDVHYFAPYEAVHISNVAAVRR
jgi:glyoxylase-like metal-dependent hydrolase (beta-lactamase superfamily II)